jgi:hypothetical protein
MKEIVSQSDTRERHQNPGNPNTVESNVAFKADGENEYGGEKYT